MEKKTRLITIEYDEYLKLLKNKNQIEFDTIDYILSIIIENKNIEKRIDFLTLLGKLQYECIREKINIIEKIMDR